MHRILPFIALLLVASAPRAQPVEGARSTVKQVYNLKPLSDENDLEIGALQRTETETYGADGNRLRVEWRDPDGVLVLAFMELYDLEDRPFGAVYFEGTDLDPNLERFEYLEDGDRTIRRVTYSGADGVPTSVNEFVYDADGLEVERRYGTAEGEIGATDTVSYDGANATGYVYARTDGSRRFEYQYRNETTDERGHWTSRVVLRDGSPSLFETRTIVYENL